MAIHFESNLYIKKSEYKKYNKAGPEYKCRKLLFFSLENKRENKGEKLLHKQKNICIKAIYVYVWYVQYIAKGRVSLPVQGPDVS